MTFIQAVRAFKFSYASMFLISCCFTIEAAAQLQADFSVDKQAGCSPLNVKFSNTSTGTSATTTWQWNFGNGNSSALKDPGATYFAEKKYTVTLTAKDGGSTSTKTIDITVYKKPGVDFTVSPSKGCVPLAVNFSANATAGDGTIANYLWDFGDGANIQGASYTTTSHTYNFPQSPPITLNVTNSFGCYATVTKNSLVQVVAGVKAAFTPSTLTLCNAGESISFLNISTGSGTLTYKWDFGDGKTSTDKSPVHVFATKGTYVVTLTTASSDGCTGTIKSDAINVANFVADFEYPAKLCLNQGFTFTNKSTKPFDKAEWWIDNLGYAYTAYDAGDYYTAFYEPGEHTIKLIVYYGNCSITTTKKVTVGNIPMLTDFVAELQGACGVPVTINFKDTSSGGVSWVWQNNYQGNTFATTKNAFFNYTSGSYDLVYLTVTNAAGCSNSVSKYIYYDKPNINISITNGNINGNYAQGCTGLKLNFVASPDTSIKDFKWNFGDGSAVSTAKTPAHTFDKAGSYTVTLDYTTNNGCKGTASYSSVNVVDRQHFDFSSKQGTVICGNTPDTLVATPALNGWNYSWSFNSDYLGYYYGNSTIVRQFDYDTTYTVTMIADNYGCRDTVIKNNYLKVLPPFPHIQQVFNTCDGSRGDIRFTEASVKSLKWAWDFGDGGTTSYTSFKDTIRHKYTSTGAFKVVLSATNGGCTARDSTIAYVLLKQKPLLTIPKSDACGNELLDFKLSGYEINPYNYAYSAYYINYSEYSDLTRCNGIVSIPNYYWQQEISGTIQGLDPAKKDLRMITSSYNFGCLDTTNFVPLKIHGPTAGFLVETHSGCFKDPVQFRDTSLHSGNTVIVKWEWDFGDGNTKTLTAKGSTSYAYAQPGYYYVRLKVTDADGCTSNSDYYLHYLTVGGPKADFTASSYNVPPNTTVYFNNASLFYNYYDNATLQWIFSDGSSSTDENTSFTFNQEGAYTVQLVTKNTLTGCTDTMKKTITVRKVNSAFTYQLSYINNNLCPPVIATFSSISTNAARLSWDFGDGGIAGNQVIVSHTYNNPGIYRVVHYSYDSNNAVDSTEDFIEIKGPYALLKADVLTGCGSLQVKLTADVKYASDYTWDFGDGTVVPTTDTAAVHTYLTPGIYVPALILKDAGGCDATSALPDQIIVDTLSASFKISPALICDSALSLFIPQVYSLSNEQLQAPVNYSWIVQEGNQHDTIPGDNASHYFHTIGTHTVILELSTPYGCTQEVIDSVNVRAGIKANVAGPDKLCNGDMAVFTGNANTAGTQLTWKWDFGNGQSSDSQNPSPQQFNTAGAGQISLVVSNGFCSDTVNHPLVIYALPVISFTPATPFACKGSDVTLTASGGVAYQWSAVIPIVNSNMAVINSTPATGVFYSVKVTDDQACSKNDSIFVKVIEPLKLTGINDLFACQGNPVQMNIAGADKYKWINNTIGISNVDIPNPSALSSVSTTYTVVGYDSYNCFTDTAGVQVRISILPLVDAGLGKQLIAGASYTLSPTVSGATSWLWSPADYLDCFTCLTPVSKPKSSLVYTLTAANADGCKASDTVSLSLICKSNLVFIPSAFSPNNDGLNDRFTITGSGVKIIRSVTIFNRWGKLVFARKNININDRNNSWDGYYNGEPMPAAGYVYSIQTECEGGEIFDYRGTVMILR